MRFALQMGRISMRHAAAESGGYHKTGWVLDLQIRLIRFAAEDEERAVFMNMKTLPDSRKPEDSQSSRSGLIFAIKRYSIHDGPGIRTTVFFKGCPLACAWCHNPEGIKPDPEWIHWPDRCIRCDACIRSCPGGALSRDMRLMQDPDLCRLDGICARVCPSEATEIIGEVMSVSHVLEEVLLDRIFYEQSGGGVTCSGGEPFMQHAFLMELISSCRKNHLHIVLDTSGYVDTDLLLDAAPQVDLFLYDLKTTDDASHLRYTGVSNHLILENLKELIEHGFPVVIRIPVIPGFNDSEGMMEEIGNFLHRLRHIQRIDLLPFHRFSVTKYERLNRSPEFFKRKMVTPGRLERFGEILKNFGYEVRIGG